LRVCRITVFCGSAFPRFVYYFASAYTFLKLRGFIIVVKCLSKGCQTPNPVRAHGFIARAYFHCLLSTVLFFYRSSLHLFMVQKRIRSFTLCLARACFCALWLSPATSAQERERPRGAALDSLERLVQARGAAAERLGDSARVAILNELSFGFRAQNFAKALRYGEEALSLARRLGRAADEATALNNIGVAYRNERKDDRALEYFLQALAIRERIGDRAGKAASYLSIGNIYFDAGEYDKARENYRRALEIRQALGDKAGVARIRSNIASTYTLEKRLDKALEEHRSILALWKELDNNVGVGRTQSDIAVIYWRLEKFDSALAFQNAAQRLYLQSADRANLFVSYINFGRILRSMGRAGEALDSLRAGYRLVEKSASVAQRITAFRQLAETFAAAGLWDSAFFYLLRHYEIRDSVLKRENEQQLNELKTRYEVEQKDKEIALLQREGELRESRLRAEQAERERLEAVAEARRQSLEVSDWKRQIQELELRRAAEQSELQRQTISGLQSEAALRAEQAARKQTTLYALGAVCVLLFLTLFAFANRFRIKQRSERELRAKNEEILRQQDILERQTVEIEITNTKLQERNLALERANEEILYQQEILEEQARDIEIVNSELQERNAQLQDLNREKNDLMGIVAHDLKNPLSTITFAASMLERYRERMSPQEMTEFLRRILHTAQYMNDMITHLLESAALEAGALNVRSEEVDCQKLMRDVVEEYRPKAAQKNIALQWNTCDNHAVAPFIALADARIVKEVLDNLVSNAVKYSPHGKNVFVRVQSRENAVRMEVEDEGPGLSEEDKKKLFGKFARLSAQPTGGEGSTGLGLSIVKKMVEAMNGRVWCESELGKGATFIVELPRA
jgi:signal transduction histidine kinase/tetratricopeptide (TPR) repeat protein